MTILSKTPEVRARRSQDFAEAAIVLRAWAVTVTTIAAMACHSLAAPQDQISSARIGFGGRFALGAWTPVWVELSAGASDLTGRLRVQVTDGDGSQVEIVDAESPHVIPAGVAETLQVLVKFGRAQGPVIVSFQRADGTTLRRRLELSDVARAIEPAQPLVVCAGTDAGVDQALRLRSLSTDQLAAHAVLTAAAEFPTHWLGYSGVDVLFLATASTDLVQQLSTQQLQAIRTWVQMGGRVVLSACEKAPDIVGTGGVLAELCPARFDGAAQLRETSELERFAGAKERLDLRAATAATFRLPVAHVTDVDGRTLVEAGFRNERHPLIITGAVGLGQSVFVAFDLDRQPVADWPDRPRLIARLLEPLIPQSATDDVLPAEAGQTRFGFGDLAGQLRQALDQFPGVALFPFSITATLVVLYLALIGPGDYFLLRRSGRRFGWTWVTFPMVVLAVCGVAVALTQVFKGQQLRVNQVNIVDVDLKKGVLRGSTWAHIFSPRADTFDLSLQPVDRLQPITGTAGSRLAWQGLPGEGFGGMSSSMASLSLARPYRIEIADSVSRSTSITRLPISQWSSRSLYGQWWGSFSQTAGAHSTLKDVREHQLEGTVTNPLDVELNRAYLFYDRWAYTVGTMRQGEARSLESMTVLDVQSLLTRKNMVEKTARYVLEPWDRQSTDVSRIVEIMMFHQAARGIVYTGLLHHYHREIDMSELLKLNRAVLWGAAAVPAAHLDRSSLSDADCATQTWDYYRVVIPVSPGLPRG